MYLKHMLYPHSTQATNRPNRHELIFFLFGGIREVSFFFFSNRDELRVIPDSDTFSLRIFVQSAQFGWNRARIHFD